MPFFNILSEGIDRAVPSRAKKPKPKADQPMPATPRVQGRSQDPTVKAEVDKRIAAQRAKDAASKWR